MMSMFYDGGRFECGVDRWKRVGFYEMKVRP